MEKVHVTRVSAGLPWRSLTGELHSPALNGAPWPSHSLWPTSGFKEPWAFDVVRRLPVRPRMLGFAGNTIVLGLLAWTIFCLPIVAIRNIRGRVGESPNKKPQHDNQEAGCG